MSSHTSEAPSNSPPRFTLRLARRKIGEVANNALGPISEVNYWQPVVPPQAEVPIDRDDMLLRTRNTLLHPVLVATDESWNLMQDIINNVADKFFSRRRLAIAMLTLAITTPIAMQILKDNPDLLRAGELRVKLNDVWDEVGDIQKTFTDEELIHMTHNPFGKIELTAEEAANLLAVGDGDSEYLANGIRKNSLGISQPECWLDFATAKLNAGMELLGIEGKATYANYAQPGAPLSAFIEDQDKTGNVQLGADGTIPLQDYPKDTPTATQTMLNHKGMLEADMGGQGDDMRDTADLILSYINAKSPDYDREFTNFIKKPSKETLTEHVADRLIEVLTSYKEDKKRIKANFIKILEKYEAINRERQRTGMGDMFLVVTQPDRLDEAEYAPYVPLDAARGVTGRVRLADFGSGGKVAGMLVTLPFYQIEKPLLADFQRRTGIRVSSIPMIGLSRDKKNIAPDGHLTPEGQNSLADLKNQILVIKQHNRNLEFTADGQSVVRQVA